MIFKLPRLRTVGRLAVLALLPVVMVATPARAQTVRDWIDPIGGVYNDTGNWSGINVPNTISESAQFNLNNNFIVTLNSGATTLVSDLFVLDGDVRFSATSSATAIYEMDDDVLISGGNLTLNQILGDVTLNVGDRIQILGGSTVSVLQGSNVTASNFELGYGGGDGTMIVDGVGSTLAVSTLSRIGANTATGTLTFQNGSTGNSLNGTVQIMAGSSKPGSTGRLNVLSGSTLQIGTIYVGASSSIFDSQEATLTVDGVGSALTMTGASTLTVGDDINPNVVSNVVVSNSAVMSSGTGDILIRNMGHLDIQDGTFNANGNLTVDGGTLTFQNGSTGNSLNDSDTVVTGGGTLDVLQGSNVTTYNLEIADGAGTGAMIVNGAGSTVSSFILRVGVLDQGTLNVEAGGQVSSNLISIGDSNGSTGVVTVTGVGSTLNGTVFVGSAGHSTLNILAGGQLSSDYVSIASNPSSDGSTVTVDGTGSTFTTETLRVGSSFGFGQGNLHINNDGLVTVTGETRINELSSVVLSGGRFEFGTLDDASSYSRISGTSGELAGDYPLSGFNDLSGLDLLITNFDTSEVRILNSGVIFGDGATPQTLANTATGEVRTISGEEARFDGIGNTNAGGINNFDGVVEFVQGITNESTGFVNGRGQFIAGGGWINDGVFAFSGGLADVLGDVANSATGQIMVGGAGTTTFFDDVTMDPSNMNINVASGSTAVFLGSYNGGNYGAGAVDILGDLRPGNSPAEVTYGGNLNFGGLANLEIEIAGLTPGSEYDVIDIAGVLGAGGTLDVSLINAFTPSAGDSFDILDWGSITGSFNAINLPTLGGSLDWDTSNLLIDGTLSVFSTSLAGDLDNDGFVGIADLNIVLSNWNQNVTPGDLLSGDPTGEGFVGIADLNVVLGNWNAGTLPTSNANIPEPASLLLLAVSGVSLVGRSRARSTPAGWSASTSS